jgi:hypothetical protein
VALPGAALREGFDCWRDSPGAQRQALRHLPRQPGAFGVFIYASQAAALAESGEEALRAFLDPLIRRDPALAGELE